MKKLFLILSLTYLFSCGISDDNSDNVTPQAVRVEWHLIKVTGGISGVNNNFELYDIVWEFNDETGQFTVNNTNEDSSIEDGLDSGTYVFSILKEDSSNYFIVNDTEFANILVDNNAGEMTLDQNVTTAGVGSDGYIYYFKSIIIYSE
ncbi:hypothetical protein [Aestuariibaculum sediminum]|uniref:Uncharacterized protein n=1 Tax=Aestuariibaculum sediminum TaxID=2770637 RepID=A0A8J6U7I2_9FLAO|nr:hypothetical protein [Aestuariibaculum sediminum]MBD0832018.1 hypothetical protein [Aestuariibaculum sediminum]